MTGKRRRNVSVASNSGFCSSSDDEENYMMSVDNSSNEQISNDVSYEPSQRRRGRGPSKRPCLNRNAMMARVNRQRKKEYLEKVESKLAYCQRENKNLSNVIQQQGIDLKRLTAEVSYLRSVLNNNSSITALLKTMNEALGKRETNDNLKFNKNGWDGGDSTRIKDVENIKTYKQLESKHFVETREGINFDELGQEVLNQTTLKPPTDQASPNDVDQLGSFESEMFDLPSSNLENATTNLFDNLDNSGICLHLNSGRISLEFCSICHLNCINSEDP